MKTYIIVDVESNGPIPGDYSMTSLGAVVVDEKLNMEFKANIKPISDKQVAEMVTATNSMEAANSQDALEAKEAMIQFRDWLKEVKDKTNNKLVFISDNNGYDWMFVCWYLWHFVGENPLGYYSENMQALYRGMEKNLGVKISDIRERELIHDSLEDAKDNAKILLKLFEKGLEKDE